MAHHKQRGRPIRIDGGLSGWMLGKGRVFGKMMAYVRRPIVEGRCYTQWIELPRIRDRKGRFV